MDFVFPARCVACRVPGHWWCGDCDATAVLIRQPACAACNRLTVRGEYCKRCSRSFSLSGVLAGTYYRGPVTAALKALKYRHATQLAPALAAFQIVALARLRTLRRSILVPLPLHPARLRQRGHNQAYLLANPISRATGIPLRTDLGRIRNTRSQTGLTRQQRLINTAGAFRWLGPPLEGETVVLVDDIYTTGATLDAAAEACRRAGARQVWGLVVAKR